jgi:hypothetical protein
MTSGFERENSGQVIRLRSRRVPGARHREMMGYSRQPAARPGADEHDDYRHRMITNALAFALCVLLVVIGVWIADTMAQMRKNQDCVLSGRRGCTPVDVPVRSRW